MPIAKHIHVNGVVQGVGFRPFVYGLANRLALRGWVCNTSAGVEIRVEGDTTNVEEFIKALSTDMPPLARLDRISVWDESVEGLTAFEIRHSTRVEGAFQPVSPDVAICPDCERELFDFENHRYLYPFINCTNCGPRFTIIKDLPYDRPATTMADFPMCDSCRREYEDPLNRRFHAQPIACPECGPVVQLRYALNDEATLSNIDLRLPAILTARRLLREGRIVAVKGLGGFHLACDALNAQAVEELRRRKGRVGKPFALMMADLSVVFRYCEVGEAERSLLTGKDKPIVLLTKKSGAGIPEAVAPGMDTLGVMLPYTPLHHVLLNPTDPVLGREPAPTVLVMTSGNFSEEPIATDNLDALERLAPLADAFLIHDREIHIRCDDSVVRVDHEPKTEDRFHEVTVNRPLSTVFLRRSRGYAPYPVRLPFETAPILAVGGELKNTFCLTRDRYAFLSQHIGDMENAEVYESFEQGVAHLSRLFRIEPQWIAHDMHPGYFTTRYAEKQTDIPRIAVQHHHAHLAACMADNGSTDRRVIGLSFDGTGYGTDGKIWGGEVLLASYADFERVAHLEYLPLPGGDAATRNPWRIAVGYAEALGVKVDDLPFLKQVDAPLIDIVRKQIHKKINAPETSSMGRLFDAVAALAGIRNEVTYEAQAAMELEVLSKSALGAASPYPFEIEEDVIRLGELLRHIIEDVRRNESASWIGARFHRTVCKMAVEVSKRIREQTGINEVALSGGVWQNLVLLNSTRAALLDNDFVVFTHRLTPANDGGLALGQAVIANAVIARSERQ
ncbi:MAG: carbamoyltransferase HypF [Chloroflexi bacterium]|nr:carbamoyltransferase HypF [Chloroflexota bacterium]